MARPRSQGIRNLQSAAEKTAKFTGSTAEKAAVGLFRWMATDHIGNGQAFQHMPTSGFLDALRYILMELFIGILTAVLTGVFAYLLIVYGIPLFFSVMFGVH